MSDEGQGYGGYASPVPSSTVPDQPDKHGLPPFSSFQDQEPSASRLLDISSWDYYSTDGRIERDGFPILVPQYRPWESKDELNKLPSFQSQFTTFSQDANGETVSLTTLTPAVPSELPSFQTLGPVPQPTSRSYPLVPAPVQAREIPGVQQQLLDERHIHLFQGPQQYYPPQQQATLLTVVKTEPLIVTQLDPQPYSGLKLDPLDSRKKERRKVRASSLESSAESDGVSSVESSGQVAAISTTSGFKSSPLVHPGPMSHDDCMDISDKPVKKKRKRCGECIGCQRKDNCGDCAPCRNDKSHQICKMRRCEKLTDKKHLLYMSHEYSRGERGRGRGKGRGGGAYRKNARNSATSSNYQINGANDSNNLMNNLAPDHSVKSESKIENSSSINQQQGNLPSMSGGVMYGGGNGTVGNITTSTDQAYQPPTRFPNTVWHQASNPDPNTIGAWTPQGQFIQQVPAHQVDDIRYSQYGISPYPTQATTVTYQSSGFIQQNGIYTNASGQNTAAAPSPQSSMVSQGSLSTTQRATPNHIINGNVEYSVEQSPRPADPYINGNYNHNSQEMVGSAPPSRCGSAQMEGASEGGGKYTNPPTPTTPQSGQQNQQTGSQQSVGQQQQGNGMPGYPPHPPQSQQSLHNSSGYPGQSNNTMSNGILGEVKEQNQKGNNDEMWSSNVKRKDADWNNEREDQWASEGTRDDSRNGETPGRPPDPPTWDQQWNNQDWNRQQTKTPSPVKEERKPWDNRQWNGQSGEWNGPAKDVTPLKNEKNGQWETQWNRQPTEWNRQPKEESPNKEEGNRQWDQQWNDQTADWNGQTKVTADGSQQWQGEHPWSQDKKESDRNQLNNRLKTMILNKQQYQDTRPNNEVRQSVYHQDQNAFKNGGSSSNNSENFLSYGHHPRELASEGGGTGAVVSSNKYSVNNASNTESNEWISKDICFPGGRDIHAKPSIDLKTTKIKEETWSHCTQTDQYFGQDNKQQEQKEILFGTSNQCVGTNNSSSPYPQIYPKEFKTKEAQVQSESTSPFKIPEPGNFTSRNLFAPYSSDTFLYNKDPSNLKSPAPSPSPSASFNAKQDEILSKVKLENDKGTETDDIDPKNSCSNHSKEFSDYIDKLKNNIKTEIPICSCHSGDVGVTEPEPGSYYTHLGAAPSLLELRTSTEQRTGLTGNAIRIEKIVYTGKEGKTTSGCPLAKSVIRRSSLDEKLLLVVKHRPGHSCQTAWIVVVIVAWEGVPKADADFLYTMLTYKLNKFGLTTSRRCATNEPRTCACQGLDPQTCGASFSFGCSWSMYYNGCKFARSKHVRKFRLTVKTEEKEVEEKMQKLATVLSPLYKVLAPESYRNQVQFENEAAECRLGSSPGRPFSGVTACIDFCAHAHKDIHNMNNGCTVVVTLNKHHTLEKPEDEQLHVLPLYVMDDTDEYGDKAAQKQKVESGAIENLTKFPCEVRVRSVPLTPCRRRKKRKDDDTKSKKPNLIPATSPVKIEHQWNSYIPSSQLQIPQVTSTVGDSRSWSPYTIPVTNWTADHRTLSSVPWSSPHTAWNRTISAQQHASFHSTQYQGSWSSMNLNEGLPLDDQVKMAPDSTTLSPSLLKGVGMVQHWPPNGIKREISDTDTCCKPQFQASTSISDQPPNNAHKIKQENINYFPHYGLNSTGLSSETTSIMNSVATQSFLPQNESKRFLPHNQMDIKSHGILPPHLFKSEHPSLVDHSRRASETLHQAPENNFKTPPIPKPKIFSNNEAIVVKTEGRTSCDTPGLACNLGQQNKKLEEVSLNNFSSPYAYQNFQNHLNPSYINFSGHPYRMANSYPATNYMNQAPFHNHLNSTNYKTEDQPKVFYSQMDLNKTVNNQSAHFYSSSQGLGIGNQFLPWNTYGPTQYLPPTPKPELIGHVSSVIDNVECFQDSQMGGVAIALGHGSVLFECAKHELHATTALHRPDRHHPTRISLVFYQHRNLNKPNHGADHWEEKMRLRKEQPPTPEPVSIPNSGNQFTFPNHHFSVGNPHQLYQTHSSQ